LGNINTIDISSKECLENIVQEYARILNSTWYKCYEPKLQGLSDETTLVLSNTRELDRVPKTK